MTTETETETDTAPPLKLPPEEETEPRATRLLPVKTDLSKLATRLATPVLLRTVWEKVYRPAPPTEFSADRE